MQNTNIDRNFHPIFITMKTIKGILIVLLIVIAIPLIIALFVPKDFNTSKDIIINKPQEEVFEFIKYIRNQDQFGAWQLSDPEMKTTSEGVDGTVGFKYSWTGDKTGTGSQTIIAIEDGKRIETELDFGFGDPARSYFVTEYVDSTQTRVTWGISGTTPYPLNLMSLLYDMGDDFETGLHNLKNILENQ